MTYPSHTPEYQRAFAQRKRRAAMELLGGKCTHCGFGDWRALQFDHIKGGGSQDRKSKVSNSNIAIANDVIRCHLEGVEKYQLLCANCNWIKRYVRKEN